MASQQEQAVVYAALILEDEGVPVTAEKINKILQAANVQVEPFWPGLYVKALEGLNISDLISNISSGAGSAPAAAAAAPAAGGGGGGGGAAEAKEDKKKKEEVKEESDEDMGFGLFD